MLPTEYLGMCLSLVRLFCNAMKKNQHNNPIKYESLGLGLGLARLFSLGLGLANQDHFQVLLRPTMIFL